MSNIHSTTPPRIRGSVSLTRSSDSVLAPAEEKILDEESMSRVDELASLAWSGNNFDKFKSMINQLQQEGEDGVHLVNHYNSRGQTALASNPLNPLQSFFSD